MNRTISGLQFWETELQGAQLPDERFRPNLIKMCHHLQEKPGHSFSAACGPSVRKAAHRLFSKGTSIDIQRGHRQKTRERCRGHELVLVVEDTTDLNYEGHGHTEGLGDIGGRFATKGLNIHTAMALTTDGEPLGLIGQHTWAPSGSGREKKHSEYPIEEKESYKWIRTKEWVNEWFRDHAGWAIVVGDREADFYEHFAWPREEPVEILVRARYLRRNIYFQGKKMNLGKVPALVGEIGQMEVRIGRQKNRKARTAKLSVRTAEIECPPTFKRKGDRVPMTLVHVKEVPTKGIKDPVEWYLLTTLEVSDLEEACQIIRFYMLRWTIERFHYVLKTGLRVERLQFDNFTRLSHALEVCSLVAWQLLWTAYLAKAKPKENASDFFDQTEIEILTIYTGQKIKTTTDYILALGSLSGFVKSKAQPLPGEKLLWQGLKLLRAMKKGFMMRNNSS